jgi:serine protease AprX
VPLGAPANDPFVITVGALDQHSTYAAGDDTAPSWTAYGHTLDGFEKPELAAPGRYLIGPVPVGSKLFATFPDRVVDPTGGFMWMSGTSFAAPIVTGAAAWAAFRHPDWTPGQIKGALMLTARALPTVGLAAGVGEVDATAAATLAAAPNADENLDAFVVTDPATGQRVFDIANWVATVSSKANWTTANWSGANWSGANWNTANWTTANWSSAGWATANWTTANWAAANWVESGAPD